MANSLWRDQLRRGKFRDVPFLCDNARQPLGRRIVVHSYPLRAKPFPEDMGRKHRIYSLTLFVIGSDYMAQRDRLIEALEQDGPGTLVHPYRGELRVVMMDGEVTESKEEGGLARFTVNFIEAGEETQPIAVSDTGDETEIAADAADDAILDDFANTFSLDGAPEFVKDSALSQLNGVLDQIDGVRKQLTPDLTVLTDATAGIGKVRTTLLSLVLTPTNLAQGILDAIHGMVLVADSARNASFALRNNVFKGTSSGSSPAVSPTDSGSRRSQKTNQAAVSRLTQRLYLTQLVRLSARAEYKSRDEAIAERDAVTDLIRAEMEDHDMTADTYQSFTRMQSALVRHINQTGAKLARVGHISLLEVEPALVTAYAFYGNVARVDELVDRNQVEHPAFMPAGVPLEVLLG